MAFIFKLKLVAIFFICLLSLISCNNQNSYWSHEESVFYIPSQGLSLHLPHNNNWIIADLSESPKNILFFGVMPEDGIGLYLFSENEVKYNSVNELTAAEIERQIYPIFMQSQNHENTVYGPLDFENCKFFRSDAVKFQTIIKIEEMGIKISGYLFVHNNCLMKYVLSEPYPSNSIYKDILDNSIVQL